MSQGLGVVGSSSPNTLWPIQQLQGRVSENLRHGFGCEGGMSRFPQRGYRVNLSQRDSRADQRITRHPERPSGPRYGNASDWGEQIISPGENHDFNNSSVRYLERFSHWQRRKSHGSHPVSSAAETSSHHAHFRISRDPPHLLCLVISVMVWRQNLHGTYNRTDGSNSSSSLINHMYSCVNRPVQSEIP